MTLKLLALHAADTSRIEAHLLRLSVDDRSLRFTAGLVTDETIRRYVAGLRFERDAVFGLIDADGVVVGIAHGCVFVAAGEVRVETAFSIDVAWRGRGLAHALMGALECFAKREGAKALVGSCVARNLRMRRVFERADMTLTREDDELHACRGLGAERGATAAA